MTRKKDEPQVTQAGITTNVPSIVIPNHLSNLKETRSFIDGSGQHFTRQTTEGTFPIHEKHQENKASRNEQSKTPQNSFSAKILEAGGKTSKRTEKKEISLKGKKSKNDAFDNSKFYTQEKSINEKRTHIAGMSAKDEIFLENKNRNTLKLENTQCEIPQTIISSIQATDRGDNCCWIICEYRPQKDFLEIANVEMQGTEMNESLISSNTVLVPKKIKIHCTALIFKNITSRDNHIDCPKPQKCQSAYQRNLQLPTYKISYEKVSHALDCKCSDCLGFLRIKQLAQMKEYPVVKEVKQVYQLQCTCSNAQKAAELQSTIPVASTSPNSSKTKPVDTPGKPTDLANLCDCEPCECKVCFNKTQSSDTKIEKPKACCCTGVCSCEACPVEELKRQVEDMKEKINKITETKTVEQIPSLADSECDCAECACPNAQEIQKPSDEECDCSTCNCPESPIAQTPSDEICDCPTCDCRDEPNKEDGDISSAHSEDCTCTECACQTETAKSGPVCDCDPCECNYCGDPAKRKGTPVTETKAESAGESLPLSLQNICDCNPCKCTPCKDPTKKIGDTPAGKIENCDQIEASHTQDCTCDKCLCGEGSDAPPLEEKTHDKETHAADCTCDECLCADGPVLLEEKTEDKETHPANCTCDECLCDKGPGVAPLKENMQDKETHPADCTCDECLCANGPVLLEEKTQANETHPADCTCNECLCDEGLGVAPIEEKMQDKETHPADCTCSECLCDEGPGVAPLEEKMQDKETHPADCMCFTCLCAEDIQHEKGCCCPECNCVECFAKTEIETHAIDCKCQQCSCIECGGQTTTITTTTPTTKDIESGQGCHCINCTCIDCFLKVGMKVYTPECKCTPCFCIECVGKTAGTNFGQTAGISDGQRAVTSAGCICGQCHCTDCAFKTERDKVCKCEICKCIECILALSTTKTDKSPSRKDLTMMTAAPLTNRSCHCLGCQCDLCASGVEKTPVTLATSDKEDIAVVVAVPLTDRSCHCLGCQCDICAEGVERIQTVTECTIEEQTANTTKPDVISAPPLTDPPPFEIPQRKPCDCSTCNCVICIQTRADVGKDKSQASEDVPPFEKIERVPCKCSVCTCAVCNKDGGTLPNKIIQT